MARTLTPQDCHVLMNELVKQATGQTTLQAVNTSTFISCGEAVLKTGIENTINSLAIVIGRTFMAVRPYNAKLRLINALNTGAYTSRIRKISFFSQDSKASGYYNTNLFTNLKAGYTNGQNVVNNTANSTKSMWEQNPAVALEMNFGGTSTWQDSITMYEEQLKMAFRNESEFGQFVSGIMTEKANDIETQKEAFNRMITLNHIAGVYDMSANMPNSAVNLTAEFNAKYGTQYSSAELRTTYLKEFLAFFVSEFKKHSDFMTERSANYHWSPTKTIDNVNYKLLRHTPKNRQRAMLYQPLFTDATANVLPEIFNPEYLDIKNYEGVNFWQSVDDRAGINVTPAIVDTTTGEQKAGTAVNLDYVVGVLYDVDACMVDYQLEMANTTPLEARKGFRNIWWTFAKNGINDFTENAIVFYMEDEVAGA